MRSAFALFVSSVALLAGCGGGTATVSLPTTSPTTNITVAISPSTAQMVDAGQTIPLTATVTNDQGSKGVNWTVSSGGGSFSSATGLTTTYTAPAVQAMSVVITATSVADPTKTATLGVTVVADPAISTSAPLPVGYVGVAYSAMVPYAGGTGTRTITLVSGTLPAGLALSGTGAITGTPTAAGTSTFTLRVTDSAATPFSSTAQLTLTIGSMAINPVNLPGATVGTAYPSTQLSTTGNIGAVTYTVSSGALPAGLTLSSTGVISGTPTAAGTSNFTIRAVDTAGQTATLPLSIVTASKLTFNNVTLPNASVNQPIANYQFQAQGGTSPYGYALANGSTLPAGLSLTSSGLLSGTPTSAGTYTFNVTATDSGSIGTGMMTPGRQSATATVTLTVSNFAVTNGALPAGIVGRAYSANVSASGGAGPYTYAVTNGALPAGLNLNPATGAITGTPSAAGNSTFTVTATDTATTRTASGTDTISVASGLTFANVTLPSATAGTAIANYQFAATGGTSPYNYALASGSTLPAGLSLSASGVLSGTPNNAGNYSFGVTATDSGSATSGSTTAPQQTATSTVTLSVAASSNFTFTGSTLPAGVVGSAYSTTVAATGGTSPYTYALASGSTLPAGLNLNTTTGVISGTPSAAGTATFSITASDSASHTATASFTVTVASTLSFANVTLPTATANSAITNYQFAASGGTAPYTYAVASGSTLPAGLSLSTAGVLSGTPTTAGTFTFGVTATDSGSTVTGSTAAPQQKATSTVTLTVNPAPGSITITPATLPNAVPNSPYSQTLTATGGTGTVTFSLVSGTLPAGLGLETSGTVDGQPTGAVGTYTFTVRAADTNGHSGQQLVTINVSNKLSPGPNNSLLNGSYAFLFTGYNNGTTGTNVYGTAAVGQIVFDGNNNVTGTIDTNSAQTGFNPQLTLTGSYTVNSDNRGMLLLNVTGSSTPTTFAISVQSITAGLASQLRVLEFDDQDPAVAAGVTGSGVGTLQTGTFATAAPTGAFVLSEIGETCAACNTSTSDFGPLAQVGAVTFTGGAVTSTGSQLDTRLTTNLRSLVPGGTITLPAGTTGRGTIALTDTNSTGFTGQPLNYVFYAVSPTQFYLLSSDAHNSTFALLSGTASLRTTGTLNGTAVAYISGNLAGNGTTNFSRQIGARVQRFVTTGTTVMTSGYQVLNGTPGATTTGTGATITTGAALGTVQFTDTDGTPYNFYMVGPNSGYSLGLGTVRGVVRIEPQDTATFSAGLYAFSTQRTPTTDYGFLGSLNVTATNATSGTSTQNEYYVLYDQPVGNRLYNTTTPVSYNYVTDNTTGFIQFGNTGNDYRGFVISGSRFVTILDQAVGNVPVQVYEK